MILGHVWRWIALITFVALLATTGVMHVRAQSADELAALRAQVSRLSSQGKYAEAIPLAERYAALARQKHGENDAHYATAISWLAYVYKAQGRYADKSLGVWRLGDLPL